MSVFVTGTGCITCVGEGVERLWQHAVDEVSGIRDGLGSIDSQVAPAAERSLAFCRIAVREAMAKAGWDSLRQTDGIILATTTGQIQAWDKPMLQFLRGEIGAAAFDEAFSHQPLGDLLQSLAVELGAGGPRTLVTSACAAGTQALALAAMWLNSGRVERCLVGGVEVLCDLTVQGFRSLQLLSPEATRPFDETRKGINLSEGAAFLCLERERSPRAMARLSGYGMTSDGYHMTAPHPEGRGSFEAMRFALRTAGLEPRDIDWVHAHGTGSIHNDAAEGAAVKALFGSLSRERVPWISSSKHIHGHALGAAGCIESVLCVEALRRQKILRTTGLRNPDPSLTLRHPTEHMSAPISHIMKNTLGFGGTNATVIFSSATIFSRESST